MSPDPKATEQKEKAGMNAIAKEIQMTKEFDELKTRLKTTCTKVDAEYLEVIATRG